MFLVENLMVRVFSITVGLGVFYKLAYPILQDAAENLNAISQILTTL